MIQQLLGVYLDPAVAKSVFKGKADAVEQITD